MVVETNNTMSCVHSLFEHMDTVVMFNVALDDLWLRNLDSVRHTLTCLLAQIISSLMAAIRFNGKQIA